MRTPLSRHSNPYLYQTELHRCRFARPLSLVILCLSDSVTLALAMKSEPHPQDISLGLIRAAQQLAVKDGCNWNYWVLVAPPGIDSLPGHNSHWRFWEPGLHVSVWEARLSLVFLPQLTRPGNLNLHLNLCMGHLMPRPTIHKINYPSVALGLVLTEKDVLEKHSKCWSLWTNLAGTFFAEYKGFSGEQATYAFLYLLKQ